jgi:hypothetical protein
VINMADPFTEEILREQAESARRQQGQTKIIDESQAPQEEFVPRDRVKTVAPPRRPAADPLIPHRAPSAAVSPMPQAARLPSPGGGPQSTVPIAPPSVPAPSSRPVSSSGSLPLPTRSTTVLPPRPQAPPALSPPVPEAPTEAPPMPAAGAPVPPVPRHTGPIPAPPPPRHTTSLPQVIGSGAAPAPIDDEGLASEAPAKPSAAPATPDAIDPNADDLQRLGRHRPSG